jgi:glc operon protein GlcG
MAEGEQRCSAAARRAARFMAVDLGQRDHYAGAVPRLSRPAYSGKVFQQERLGLAEAERARDAILAAVTPTDNPIALAIADEHGLPILLLRQDGAPPRMLSRARAKAYTAANLGLDTVVFRDEHVKAKQRTLNDWGDPMITTLQGGLAIKVNGKVVGGIAMSGNTTIRDEDLARIGLEAMGVRP